MGGYTRYKIIIESVKGMGRPSIRYFSVLSNENIDAFKNNMIGIMKIYNYRILDGGVKRDKKLKEVKVL